MIQIDTTLEPASLQAELERFWALSGAKIRGLCETYPVEQGSPVFTVAGRYTSQGWTEWTQGFQYGAAILHFDATADRGLLNLARRKTRDRMAAHLSHIGVHDHGFNTISTYGNSITCTNSTTRTTTSRSFSCIVCNGSNTS